MSWEGRCRPTGWLQGHPVLTSVPIGNWPLPTQGPYRTWLTTFWRHVTFTRKFPMVPRLVHLAGPPSWTFQALHESLGWAGGRLRSMADAAALGRQARKPQWRSPLILWNTREILTGHDHQGGGLIPLPRPGRCCRTATLGRGRDAPFRPRPFTKVRFDAICVPISLNRGVPSRVGQPDLLPQKPNL